MSAQFDVQIALKAALDAATVCQGRIYDHAPQGVDFPLCEFAEPTLANDWHSGSVGTEISYTLQIWSEYAGNKECIDNYELIRTALDGKLLTCKTGVLRAYVQGGPIMREADGVRRRMIVRVILSQQE